MREILFRGKREDGKWAHGFYYAYIRDDNGQKEHCILQDVSSLTQDFKINYVDPATVGQHTGLKDKNGVEIYEGDILRKAGCFIGYVKYCAPLFYRVPLDKWSIEHGVEETVVNCGAFVTSEVIGNIHDNPELLEVL